MKVTYSWLKTLTEFDWSPSELVDKLTMLGLEVDSCNFSQWDFDGVVVGEVTKKEAHKNSDKLWVCEVNIGTRKLSIVCGAPNVEVGQKVPVAPEGTYLPVGKTIRAANIRGVESQGMICSEAELGISSRKEVIMVLSQNVEYGKKLNEVLGDGEIVIDIDVTPNRPDCFGVIGVAREIAAIAGTILKKPPIIINESDQTTNDLIKITIKNPEKCPRYTARFIGDVSIQPSPWWLVQKLEAVGIRSINNVVDVTNYVMMETGQPLHAFDYDLLKGHEIIVQTALDGKEFVTLDEKAHTLDADCLMICDGEREVAIGGIMGGLNSEVSDSTKNILLESAYFDPVNIRRTSKKLNISSESSRRFERGTDPNGVIYALNRAAQLISELAVGKITQGVIDVYPSEIKPVKVNIRPKRVENLLGVPISSDNISKILSSLDFKKVNEDEKKIAIEVPTFRPDVTKEADLIEEVSRVFGFENIPSDTTATIDQNLSANQVEDFTKRLGKSLISLGFSQLTTYSLINRSYAEIFSEKNELVELVNPLSEDMAFLRPSLIPGLLSVIRWNLNRKNRNLKIFELGNVFVQHDSKINENLRLTAILSGENFTESWKIKSNSLDIYDIKGYIEYLFARNNLSDLNYKFKKSNYTTNNTIILEIDNEYIGFLGQLKSAVLEKFDIEADVFVIDLSFSELFNKVNWQKMYSPVPKYPPIRRDIAITVEEALESENISRVIRINGGKFLQDIKLFDVYKGDQIGSKNKSLAYNLTFYSLERTLTDDEVDSQIQKILNSLEQKFSARLRK